jgi:hypothetical protein
MDASEGMYGWLSIELGVTVELAGDVTSWFLE